MARTYKTVTSLMDWSTINLDRLHALPVYKLPDTYHVSQHMGNACYGDAPGYPSYFTQSVYNDSGNTPSTAPEYVITSPVTGALHIVVDSWKKEGARDWDHWSAIRDRRLRRLWNPLPENHERVQIWIMGQYAHFHRCYFDPSRDDYGRGKGGSMVWPIPDYELRKVARPDSFPSERFMGWLLGTHPEIAAAWEALGNYPLSRVWYSDLTFRMFIREQYGEVITEYDAAMLAAVQPDYDAYIALKAPLAVPENHMAVRLIREFYPEHQPVIQSGIEAPLPVHQDDWWERYASRERALEAGADIA